MQAASRVPANPHRTSFRGRAVLKEAPLMNASDARAKAKNV
jgi:hypothetical protein